MTVRSISISPTAITLKKGESYLNQTVKVNGATTTEYLEWCSQDPSIAGVHPDTGRIIANKVGTTKIYVNSEYDRYKRACITVTVTSGIIPIESVTLNQTSISLEKGDTFKLCADVYPKNATNRSIRWKSGNTNIATVSGGVVTAKSKGWTYIYAEATDGSEVYARCYVKVTYDVLVTSITASWSKDSTELNKTLTVGQTARAYETVEPCDATNRCVRWSSSNANVAFVNPDSGFVTAKAEGTAKIRATACDDSGVYGECTLYVEPKKLVTSIEVSPETKELKIGETCNLGATVSPSNATVSSVKWSSSDPTVASVNCNTGEVTAKAGGRVAIYAKAQDGSGKSDYCCITVRQDNNNPVEDRGKNEVKEDKVADPVDVYSGAHVLKNTIITLLGGQGLSLVLQYDSTKLATGVFGTGWYHNYEKHLESANNEIRVYSSPSSYLRYTSNDSTVYTCTTPNKNGYVLTVDSSQQYPYILNCNSECTEYYDTNGYLAKIVDKQGFETLITYSAGLTQITDTVSGKNICLETGDNCKVSRVYDDALRDAEFTYENDNLSTITDLNGNTLSYTYNENGQVLTGTDSNQICYFTNTYDECGRVATQTDGITGSTATIFSYQGNKRITTNRNGHTSTRIYNDDGLLVRYTDENGNSKRYSYDSHYNIIKETDARGNSVVKYYNKFNKPTIIIDKNGKETRISYDDNGNVTKIKYPTVNGVASEETFVYNARNQITQHTDLRGTLTSYDYDTAAMPLSKKVGNRTPIYYSYQNGLLKSQTDAMGNTVSYGHNAIGQVTSMTDAENNITHYEYDACGNLLKTTDPNGKTIVTTYDGNHQKKTVKDANGNITEYCYNGNMKNELVILPDNNTIRYEFDGEDRPIKVTDQAGNATITEYDKAGRVVAKHFADGGNAYYQYDGVGNVIKETNPKGAVTTKSYDANGNVLSVEDNEGNITRYQYDAVGRKVRAVNAVSGTVVYEYSKAGDLLSETDALGNKKSYTYDAFGNMLTATDAKGGITTYTYDANNNILSVRDALGNTTNYTYNSKNQLVTVKDAKNNTITYGYDALGRRTTITDAKNNVFTTVYDGNGNVLKILDAKGNTVSETVYNSLNLPASVVDATGKTTNYTYTPLGKVHTATDSMNHRQEYSYNTRGQNTAVRDANNCTSRAEYDLLGNITKLTGPLGSIIDYTYDDMGRLIFETTSSGGTISYGYNELNVKELLTNARGQKRKFFYDATGRITGFVSEEDSVSYTYDANGNVLTVTDSNGTIKREYDALNRVVKLTDTFGKSICYEYDAVGNLITLVYPDNTSVKYTYDVNNNLVSVTDWENRVTTYTYDVNNMVVGVTKPDGSITTTVYDNKQRIISTVEKTASGTVITGFEYVYDTLSRIVEEKHLAENTKMCYTYDSLNRVTSRTIKNESGESISVDNYTYDAAGNITESPDNSFVYDANNCLIAFNGKAVSYDMDGNILHDGWMPYSYDSANRLIKACDHSYTYNAEDVRIRNLCSDADTTYTYNTNCKLSQLLTKTTNGITTKYVYGLGLIGQEKNGEFKTYHFDFRGSTVAITDINGNITDTFKYDTYGNVIERTGTTFVIFGYNGRDGVVTDKNGLIYMRARYYSPELHRFVNADILHGAISDSTSLNRYSYVNGNPVSFVDPFGLEKERGGQPNRSYNNPSNSLIKKQQHSIVQAPLRPTYPPNDELRQIENYIEYIKLFNKSKKDLFYYSTDYQNHAQIKVDDEGNITYIFNNYKNGSFKDEYVETHYHFVVQKAGYWQKLLDCQKIDIIDDEWIEENIIPILDAYPTVSGLPTSVDFTISMLGLLLDLKPESTGEYELHNTRISNYLYDRVVGRDPNDDVAILSSIDTYTGVKYFWQDSLDVELKEHRSLY